MPKLLVYYLAYVFVPTLIAFCIVWWKQRASLPASLGIVRIVGTFAAVWGSAVVTFAALHFTTALAGYENLSEFEGSYALVAGLVGFKIGMVVIDRMLKKVGAPTV
jgi:hypothetical protein